MDLLRADDPGGDYLHLGPPDRGVDILHRDENRAYQCKADERGALGTIPAAASLGSLRTAVGNMNELGWGEYFFATNANYSGNGTAEVLKLASELGLSKESIRFRGPDFWSELCEKHLQRIQNRLDYRLLVSETEVIEAFRKAQYYEDKVQEYQTLIQGGAYVIELANNRTPLRLQIPFSPDLTIEHCVDVAMELLGLSLDSEEYLELGTSARPRVLITIDRIPQVFSKKLGEYTTEEIQRLEFFIKIIWKDELQEPLDPGDLDSKNHFRRRLDLVILRDAHGLQDSAARGKITVSRFEESLQQTIWRTVSDVSE